MTGRSVPKRPPPKPRDVRLEAVRRGDKVYLPVLDGREGVYVKDRVPEHGLYITLGQNSHGIFASARDLWAALDEVIDIEDKHGGGVE